MPLGIFRVSNSRQYIKDPAGMVLTIISPNQHFVLGCKSTPIPRVLINPRKAQNEVHFYQANYKFLVCLLHSQKEKQKRNENNSPCNTISTSGIINSINGRAKSRLKRNSYFLLPLSSFFFKNSAPLSLAPNADF